MYTNKNLSKPIDRADVVKTQNPRKSISCWIKKHGKGVKVTEDRTDTISQGLEKARMKFGSVAHGNIIAIE